MIRILVVVGLLALAGCGKDERVVVLPSYDPCFKCERGWQRQSCMWHVHCLRTVMMNHGDAADCEHLRVYQ